MEMFSIRKKESYELFLSTCRIILNRATWPTNDFANLQITPLIDWDTGDPPKGRVIFTIFIDVCQGFESKRSAFIQEYSKIQAFQ